jgi:hypothetical protein
MGRCGTRKRGVRRGDGEGGGGGGGGARGGVCVCVVGAEDKEEEAVEEQVAHMVAAAAAAAGRQCSVAARVARLREGWDGVTAMLTDDDSSRTQRLVQLLSQFYSVDEAAGHATTTCV